jgi:hypothetical protein
MQNSRDCFSICHAVFVAHALILKLCPFCGDDWIVPEEDIDNNHTVELYIVCCNCDSQSGAISYDYGPYRKIDSLFAYINAADAWNRRND